MTPEEVREIVHDEVAKGLYETLQGFARLESQFVKIQEILASVVAALEDKPDKEDLEKAVEDLQGDIASSYLNLRKDISALEGAGRFHDVERWWFEWPRHSRVMPE